MTKTLEILYQDDHIVVINKPSGLLVHRSEIDSLENENALETLREQIAQKVYPVHRLDKPTSGCLVFALDKQTESELQQLFATQKIQKTYHAIVRGFAKKDLIIDYPLKKEWDKKEKRKSKTPLIQHAKTHLKTIQTTELPIPSKRYPTTRYSLVELKPKTGRKHQLRRHLAHIRHPIIGDTRHGDGEYNKIFREHFANDRLLLHASTVEFTHPISNQRVSCIGPLRGTMHSIHKSIFPEAKNRIGSETCP